MTAFDFLLDTYETERMKTLSVWSAFEDDDLEFRPAPRIRTPHEHMVHQCVSEDNWMKNMLGIDTGKAALPPKEARLDFLRHYADVSQLPVVDQSGRAIGILDESDVLVKVHREPSHFNDPVKTAMTDRLETLPPNANIKDLLEVFDRGRVAIVMDGEKFLGLITRTDLLSYLRLHMPKSSVPPTREYL